ncbi:E3 SUMO-protein ligase [Nymphaea thermarum]|nr:E3 SUMO-protein ligase [Nymphaea thermarum]
MQRRREKEKEEERRKRKAKRVREGLPERHPPPLSLLPASLSQELVRMRERRRGKFCGRQGRRDREQERASIGLLFMPGVRSPSSVDSTILRPQSSPLRDSVGPPHTISTVRPAEFRLRCTRDFIFPNMQDPSEGVFSSITATLESSDHHRIPPVSSAYHPSSTCTIYALQVLSLIPKESEGERFEEALARRCVGGGAENAGDSDIDLEVVVDIVPVNLRCPAFLYSLEHRVPLIGLSQDRCVTMFDDPF